MGPSGSGKSSLLDILAGHDKSGGVRGLVEYFTKTERVNARGEEGVGAAHSTMPGEDVGDSVMTLRDVADGARMMMCIRIYLPSMPRFLLRFDH